MIPRSIMVGLLGVFGYGLAVALAGGGGGFDKLSDADRKVFQERFTKDVWPLLQRNGKDGCVGCHSPGTKTVSSLKFKGDPSKDFAMLLKEGFFLPNDSGSLLTRITSTSKKERMPLNPRDPWSAAEIDVLRKFVADLDKKQKAK